MAELPPLAITIATVAGTIGVAWAAGRGIARFGLPAVLGELAAGLALGPSVLGQLAPTAFARVFAPDALTLLTILAQAAVFLFMLLVGLELHLGTIRREARGIARIAGVSLAAPLAMGALLALWLLPRYSGPIERPVAFVIFVGTALAVTAMPVLSRILNDLGAQRTDVGTVAVACAALDDLNAWTLLAVVVAIVHAEGHVGLTLAGIAAFLGIMVVVVRPLLRALLLRLEGLGFAVWTILILVAAALAAIAARASGLDAVFGPFLIGVFCHDAGRRFSADGASQRIASASERLERGLRRASVPLMPAFFVLIGARTDISALTSAGDWLTLGIVVVIACAAKVGAGTLAALTRFQWRKALALGLLLNTRGLVALVVLDVGRALGVLSPALFAMFVVMAFVTTLVTVPALMAMGWPASELTGDVRTPLPPSDGPHAPQG